MEQDLKTNPVYLGAVKIGLEVVTIVLSTLSMRSIWGFNAIVAGCVPWSKSAPPLMQNTPQWNGLLLNWGFTAFLQRVT